MLTIIVSKTDPGALPGVAQLVGCHPAKQKFPSSTPSQGTCLGCGFSPWSGYVGEATDRCFSLTSMFLSLLSFPLSKNKQLINY